jgi:pimeloyl-ACP methyl ester carboxylesterase
MGPSMFSPSVRDEVAESFADSVRAAFRPDGFRAMARASFEDQSHVLPEVDVPTLLLYADHDVRASTVVGESLHAVVRESQLVVLRGSGHMSSVEAPTEVTRELRRFLRSAT